MAAGFDGGAITSDAGTLLLGATHPVEHDDDRLVRGDGSGEAIEKPLHRFGVGIRQDQRKSIVAAGLHRRGDIEARVKRLSHKPGARSPRLHRMWQTRLFWPTRASSSKSSRLRLPGSAAAISLSFAAGLSRASSVHRHSTTPVRQLITLRPSAAHSSSRKRML